MAVTREEIIEALKEMTLLEASQLVKDIEETFGVSAAAPAAVAVAAPAEGGAAGAAERATGRAAVVGHDGVLLGLRVREHAPAPGCGYP